MPVEKEAAETNETVVEPAKVETEVVVKDADLEKTVEKTKAEQTEEENREQARRRREDERDKALEKRELDTVIRITGGINPYTNGKIEDRDDLEEFYLMKKIEKDGGDPVADYAKALKAQRKAEKETKEKLTKDVMTKEQAAEDWAKLRTAHPEITLTSLMADQDFLDYAEGKIGVKPLTEIYEGYLKLTGKKKAEDKEVIVKPSPGSLGNPAKEEPEFYTKAQLDKFTSEELRKMSDKEFKKVEKSREHWIKKK